MLTLIINSHILFGTSQLADGERMRSMDAAANEVWTYLLEKKGSSWPTQTGDKKEDKEKTKAGKEVDVADAEGREVTQKYEPIKKGRKSKKSPKRRAEEVLVNIRRKQSKVAATDAEYASNTGEKPSKLRESLRTAWRKSGKAMKKQDTAAGTDTMNKSQKQNEQNTVEESSKHSLNDESKSMNPAEILKWAKLEKGLYEKGLEIFGKNRYCFAIR